MNTRFFAGRIPGIPLPITVLIRLQFGFFIGLWSVCRADTLVGIEEFGPGNHTYTIPANVIRVVINAAGGGGQGFQTNEWSAYGGGGGSASASYTVAPGHVVSMQVGSNGEGGGSTYVFLNSVEVVGADGGGGGYEIDGIGYDGGPGGAYFNTGSGYVANSGAVWNGGAANGGAPGNYGGNANVLVHLYSAQAATITSATSVAGPVGMPVSYQITATGFPTSYGATGLPSGLSLNSTTGLISGAFASTGTYSITVSATGSSGTAQATVTWTAYAPPVANNPTGVHLGGFTATWSAAGAPAYLLDVSTNSGFSTFVSGYNARNVGNAVAYVVTGLSANVVYYYRVRASYLAGVGANSNTAALITAAGTLVGSGTYYYAGSYVIPANANRLVIQAAGWGGAGAGEYEEEPYWERSGGAGGRGSGLYAVTGGQVVMFEIGSGGTVANGTARAWIAGGLEVRGGGGGAAHYSGSTWGWLDGPPGDAYFDPAHGLVAGSGQAIVGGGAAGGQGNQSGGQGGVSVWAYVGPIAPTITTQPQSLAANAGTSVTFTVDYAANPPPVFQWRKNGSDIAGATQGTLAIPNVQPASAGSYSVVLINGGGSVASAAATLTVADPPPTAPTALNYVEKTETTVTLIWNPSYDNIGVVSYSVFRGGTLIGTTTDRVYADGGLTTSTAYGYTVKAVDTASQSSDASNTLNVTTNANSSADTDGDGIPNVTETALGTNGSVAANAATTTQTQQVIHRPIQ